MARATEFADGIDMADEASRGSQNGYRAIPIGVQNNPDESLNAVCIPVAEDDCSAASSQGCMAFVDSLGQYDGDLKAVDLYISPRHLRA